MDIISQLKALTRDKISGVAYAKTPAGKFVSVKRYRGQHADEFEWTLAPALVTDHHKKMNITENEARHQLRDARIAA